MAELLSLDRVSVEFATFEGVARAVDRVSLTLEEGEILGVVGEAGSGKTVLLDAILGLVRPPGRVVEGRILFDQRDLLTLEERELRAIRGKQIGLIVSDPRRTLNPLERVGKQVAQVIIDSKGVSRHEAVAQAIELLEVVGIPDARRRALAYPHELSGGMAQRVLIAMALHSFPRVLLADEPTANLDVTIQLQILELISDLIAESSASSIIVTRDLGIVAHFCQRVAVMCTGRVVEVLPVSEFFDRPQHEYSEALLQAARATLAPEREVVR